MRLQTLTMRSALLLGASVSAWAMAGCGGTGPGSAGGSGRAQMVIHWPERSRLIPDASNSIKVVMSSAQQVVASTVVPRPSAGGQASVSFDTLPPGDLTVLVSAYPQADGTGVVQASATIPLTINPGEVTPFSVTMASTIDHMEVSPATASVVIGATAQLTATAKDAAGSVVLTSPAKVQWASSDSGVATVDAGGLVTAVAVGIAQVTVTDTESGKSAQASVTVTDVPGTGTPEYTVTDLGVLSPDPGYSQGMAVNNTGQAVGASLEQITSHGFLWQNGAMSKLNSLNSDDSYAYAISDSGVAVGVNGANAALWQNGQMTDLGNPGGFFTGAYGVNTSGQVVGTSYDLDGGAKAYLWSGGQPTDLGTLGGPSSFAHAINSQGKVVGGADTASTSTDGLPIGHAFVWQNGQMTDLGTIGAYESVAYAISDNDVIVGQVFDESVRHGFVWQNGQMTDIGVLSADLTEVKPLSVNGQGVVVGLTSSPVDSRAFRWSSAGMYDLNDLIDPNSGWTLAEAHGINDQGQIVGTGTVNGSTHAFLLTPTGRSAKLDRPHGGRAASAGRTRVAPRKPSRYDVRYALTSAERRRLLRMRR
jgi:probable HAF family extracellular repeat protein